MSQSHIIEHIKTRSIYIIKSPHRDFLRLRSDSPSHKLMGKNNISLLLIHMHLIENCFYRLIVGGYFFSFILSFQHMPYIHRLYKWQHIHAKFPELILKYNRFRHFMKNRGHINTSAFHQFISKRKPFSRIMIPTDNKRVKIPVRQAVQKPVKKLHCLRARHRFVIHVSCNQYPVSLLFIYDFHNLI